MTTTRDGEAAADPARRRRGVRAIAGEVIGRYGMVLLLVALVIGFSIALPTRFPTGTNVTAMLADQAVPGILALAVILPLTVGEFDLSVGATMGFTAIVTAWSTAQGLPTPLAFPAGILLGMVIGAINAFLIVKLNVNAFVATLGVATILSGGNLFITQGAILFEGIPTDLTGIGKMRIAGLAPQVLVFLLLAVLLWYVLERTPYGRYVRATGLGREAARLSGVKTRWMLASAFVASGGLAGLAGVLQIARIGAAPPTIGPEFLLPAYAAAFLGATTIMRGFFNVIGTVVGVLVLAVGINGLALLGAPFWVSPIFNGVALVLAVSVAALVEQRRKRTT